ncbi:PiggyBac transposable element-derived protein 4 [Eumeta japonica]|uniref:PiggyBac transposable element-derived protein 4 n=1 Tax=Eumeta variegata TaxID=151549 RepID=A0A4C1Z1N4_EUMVA|nr:PiggyBac transposable element-derived protein 4 [Eumeta japonica]
MEFTNVSRYLRDSKPELALRPAREPSRRARRGHRQTEIYERAARRTRRLGCGSRKQLKGIKPRSNPRTTPSGPPARNGRAMRNESAKDVDLSDVEDHVELDDMVPTDSDSDHDIQPIRLPQHHRRSGVILSSDSETEEIPEPVDCFTNFITADMLRKILTHTNEEIEIRSTKYKDKTATIAPTCEEELTALFGLLLLSAAKKDNHLTSLELFDPVFSGTRYISVMSRERFDFLLNCLRFDDKSTRDERKAQDKFAPIREWWEVFIQICRDSYKAGSYLTIDEQLLGFRGRCPFRMYIPSKPNKYGLKILMLCDSKTNYMLNAMPYVGKTETNGDSLGSYYVKTLTENLWVATQRHHGQLVYLSPFGPRVATGTI